MASDATKTEVADEYVSEFTDFMNHFLQDHPEVVADQRRGRSIYWDRQVDFKAQEAAEAASVPTPGYCYFELEPDRAELHDNRRGAH